MLSKINSKNQITLPKKLLCQLGIAAGEERYVTIQVEGDHLALRPVHLHIEGVKGASANVLSNGLDRYGRLRQECEPLLEESERTGPMAKNGRLSGIAFLE